MSKVDKYMPLWIGDYLADTTHLTTAQHGAYLLLIMAYWRKGPLRNDDSMLAATAKMSPAEWRKNKTTILDFFSLEDGEFMHKRIDTELVRAGELRKKAKAAADARWGAKGMQKSMPNGCSNDADASLEHMLGASPSPSPLPCIGISPKSQSKGKPKIAGIELRKKQFEDQIAALDPEGVRR